MAKQNLLTVQDSEIRFITDKNIEFFSLTDIAKKFNPDQPSSLIANWMRNKDTIEFLGTWEKLNNVDFNLIEFDKIKNEAGSNRFVLSLKRWVSETRAIGIQSKAGRYGGTYAHRDLAFCYWISPPFQLYILKEFQRLKEQEAQSLEWNVKRTLAKVNYRIHTDAIKENLIPEKIEQNKAASLIYASEADVLNVALFGMTAKQWRDGNKDKKGNIRDNATTEQLLVLANMENLNAEFIKNGLDQLERLQKLNEIAIYQMSLLLENSSTIKTLKKY